MAITENTRRDERGGFLLFLALITLALVFVAWPFASALLWAVLAAIMFQPLYCAILRTVRGGENRAAIITLLILTVAIIVPAVLIGEVILDQATDVYLAIQEQRIDASFYFDRIHDGLPLRLREMLDASGYGEFEALQERVSQFLRDSLGAIAQRALAIGGNAFAFVLSFGLGLYVTYFLLRDGRRIGAVVAQALPLEPAIAGRLVEKFVAIVRATIKGSIVVGLVQGALGAATFWIVGVPSAVLLGLLMAIFSLLPALGPAIIWLPIAIYLLATSAIWQGLVVIASGVLVIGLADNVLRPILVGRDTGIPDWIVLVSTLGGIATLGLGGIVIGPVIAGLFLASWSLFREQREAARDAA
ncbi:AI-2E family transporter [Altericroceibacterium xinjiangense]|uniref:AI-2E family transporter n=1 Tax=Altericroceibacterium xinjiangense TaxID=762261 RepID=UPI000F7DAD29|nr:AI-2E family transporter [Altericroceibacterium xinjiangense]